MDNYDDWFEYEVNGYNTDTQPDVGGEVIGWSLGHKDLSESVPANDGRLVEFEYSI